MFPRLPPHAREGGGPIDDGAPPNDPDGQRREPGLSQARRTVEAHGGQLRVDSAADGVRVTLSLPVHLERQPTLDTLRPAESLFEPHEVLWLEDV